MPGSPVPGAVFTLQPIAIAGLVAALVSGLLAAGTARTVMRKAAARTTSGGSDDASFKNVSDERLRDIAEALPQIVWITDASGMIEYYSRRWFEYSGASPDSSDPKYWRGFVHPEDLERLISSWREAAALGRPWQAEYRLLRVDGSYLWHLGQAVPVTDAMAGSCAGSAAPPTSTARNASRRN